mgnify:CR=1
ILLPNRVGVEERDRFAENADGGSGSKNNRRVGGVFRHEHNLRIVFIHAPERKRVVEVNNRNLVAADVLGHARVDDIPVVDIELLHAVAGKAECEVAAYVLRHLVVAGDVLLIQQGNTLDDAIEARLDNGAGQGGNPH